MSDKKVNIEMDWGIGFAFLLLALLASCEPRKAACLIHGTDRLCADVIGKETPNDEAA